MPTITSDTQLANLALQKLGESPVMDINDSDKRARTMKLALVPVRQAMLRNHTFNFSVHRVALQKLADDPAFGWSYAYALPTDFIRAISLNEDETSTHRDDFVIEGKSLLTDFDDASDFRYVRDILDTTFYDSLFVDALSLKLAMQTCHVITGSTSKLEAISKEFHGLSLPSAEAADARDDHDRTPWHYRESRLVRMRRTSSLG